MGELGLIPQPYCKQLRAKRLQCSILLTGLYELDGVFFGYI